MKYKVLVTANIDPAGIEYLKSNDCEVLNEEGIKLKRVADYAADCEGILTRTEIINDAVYEAAENLRVVGKHGVGVDNIDIENATKRGIQVVNAPEANTESVVEHTITLILAIAKNLRAADREMRSGNYHIRDILYSIEVREKVLGLIGLGRIGTQVGLKAFRGLDMRVIAYDPYVDPAMVPEEIELIDSLHDLLSKSDFVSLHLPYLPSTRHIIGADEFNQMKESAYFINAARGQIVDENALIAALSKNRIAGAGIDVFEVEPPKKENRLFRMDNIILTPHNAALTREAKINMAVHAAMGIVDVLRGKRPSWTVNTI